MTETTPFPHSRHEDELQAITAQMVRLIAEQQHLLCAQLAPPLQATLCDRLASALPQCFVLRVTIDAPGRLLAGVLAAVGIGGFSQDTSGPRRDLALRLSSAQQRGQAIVLLLAGAEHLNDEDAAVLLHFFPAGATSVVLVGAGDAANWAPCRQALAAGAKVHACVYRDVGAATAQGPAPAVPVPRTIPAADVPTDPAGEPPPAPAAAPPLLNLRVEPRASPDGGPPRQGRTHRRLERRLRRWRSLALIEAVLVLGLAALLVEPHLRPPADRPEPATPAQVTPRDVPPAMASPPPEIAAERLAPPEPPSPPSVPEPPAPSADPTPPAAAPPPSAPPATVETEPSPAAPSPVPEAEREAPSPEVAPPPPANDTADAAPTPPPAEPAPQPPSTAPPSPPRAPEYEPPRTGVEAPAPSLEAMQEAERYAERAEQELHRGQLAAAANSIARGLALDPRNLHLLDLQVVMRSARSPNAPPLPGAP